MVANSGAAQPTFPAPNHPGLRKLYFKAIENGEQIRYADEERLVTWKQNEMGCVGVLFVITLAIITLGLALLFGLLALLDKSGTLTTYTVKKNGKIKKKVKGGAS